MKKSKISLLFVAVLSTVILWENCETTTTPQTTSASKDSLTIFLTSLPALGSNYKYEGWLIVDNGSYVSTGTFTATSSNPLKPFVDTVKHTIYVGSANAKAATAFVLTIEPANDTDPNPSSTKFLAGDFSSTATEISISMSHKNALGADFITKAKATVVKATVATPTDASISATDTSGIWFVDGTNAGITNLPTLPSGWKYEGWLVRNGHFAVVDQGNSYPFTTGKFTSGIGSDEFNGFSGTLAAPAFPGEDFLRNAPQGQTFPYTIKPTDVVAVSIEPNPDDHQAPFSVKLFSIFFTASPLAVTPTDVVVPTKVYTGLYILGLDNTKNPEPTGKVTRTL